MAHQILPALPALKRNSKRPPGPRLRLGDHMYSYKCTNTNSLTWRCLNRTCPGSARTNLDRTDPVAVNPHTMHPADVSTVFNRRSFL